MERSQQEPWIQVIGRIAVHRPGRQPAPLGGATRVLLAILVAAGPEGTSVDQIAHAYWPVDRPVAWAVALRVSASHLEAQLPDGWSVTTADGHMRLTPGTGFVDTWRIEQEHEAPLEPPDSQGWVHPGAPFAGIAGIDLIDQAINRIENISPTEPLAPRSASPFSGPLPLNDLQHENIGAWIRTERRAIVSAEPERHAAFINASLDDGETTTHIVVGDRDLLLPLGPFAMTFPELREAVDVEQGVVDTNAVSQSFWVTTTSLAAQATERPQRLLIVNADQLDTKSLELAARLIGRDPVNGLSTIMCADGRARDLRWLDFTDRCVIAGCSLFEVDRPKRARGRAK